MSHEKRSDGDNLKRVAIIFAGGPAPGANAVISATAISFLDTGREVIGFHDGYQHLQQYHPLTNRLQLDLHYRVFHLEDVTGIRNTQGVIIRTSRANPGKFIATPDDLEDPEKSAPVRNIYSAFIDLEIDALISIGGDDTLKTANIIYEYQKRLPPGAKRIKIVHLPKTIDNDYEGIDFTFGYFTAVDFMAKEVKNLRADAASANAYYIVESMGRKAGWLSYGVGLAGEADLIISVEDVTDEMLFDDDVHDPETGEIRKERRLRVDLLVEQMLDLIMGREKNEGKHFGIVVLAEGLAEIFPEEHIKGVPKDEHGHISIGRVDIGRLVARIVADEYEKRTGKKKKITGLQLGFESRCAPPHAFDVMLGSQLGIGAYRALVEEDLSGYMVSVSGQLDLNYVPFSKLVNPETLKTEVRYIKRGSDFHRLARFLESQSALRRRQAKA